MPPAAPQASSEAMPRVRAQELLRGQSAVPIKHQGQDYRLRATRQGKLILTQ